MSSEASKPSVPVHVITYVYGSLESIALDSRYRAKGYITTLERLLGHALGRKTHVLALAAVSGLAVSSSIASKASNLGLPRDEFERHTADGVSTSKQRSRSASLDSTSTISRAYFDTREQDDDKNDDDDNESIVALSERSKQWHSPELIALQEQLDQSLDRIHGLNKQLDDANARCAERESELVVVKKQLLEQSDVHNRELTELKVLLKSSTSQHDAELEKERLTTRTITNDLATLRGDLAQTSTQHASQLQDFTELKLQLLHDKENLTKKVSILQEQLQHTIHEHDQQVAHERAAVREASENLTQSRAEIARLSTSRDGEVQELQSSIVRAKKDLDEYRESSGLAYDTIANELKEHQNRMLALQDNLTQSTQQSKIEIEALSAQLTSQVERTTQAEAEAHQIREDTSRAAQAAKALHNQEMENIKDNFDVENRRLEAQDSHRQEELNRLRERNAHEVQMASAHHIQQVQELKNSFAKETDEIKEQHFRSQENAYRLHEEASREAEALHTEEIQKLKDSFAVTVKDMTLRLEESEEITGQLRNQTSLEMHAAEALHTKEKQKLQDSFSADINHMKAQHLQSTQQYSDQITRLHTELDQLKEHQNSLIEERKVLETRHAEDMQREKDLHSAKIKTILTEHDKELEEKQGVSEQLRADIGMLNSEFEKLKSQHMTIHSHQTQQLQRLQVQTDGKLSEMEVGHAEAIKSKEEELEQIKLLNQSELQDLEDSHNEEIEYMKNSMKKTLLEVEQLQKQHKVVLETKSQLEADLGAINSQLKGLKRQYEDLQADHIDQKARLDEQQRDHEVTVSSLERQIDEVEALRKEAESRFRSKIEQMEAKSSETNLQMPTGQLGRVLSYPELAEPEQSGETVATRAIPPHPSTPLSKNFSRRQPSLGQSPQPPLESSRPDGAHNVDSSNAHTHNNALVVVPARSPPRRRSNSSAAKVHAITGDSAASDSVSIGSMSVPPSPAIPQSPVLTKEKGFRGLIRRTSGKLKRQSLSSRTPSLNTEKQK